MNARMLLILLAAAPTAACASSRASAQPAPYAATRAMQDNWELLGSRKVNFRAERDVIAVKARRGTFRRLRLEVDNGNVEMYDIIVHFRNGDRFSPPTRLNFRDGERSRIIDLPGQERFIERIEFRYRSEVKRGRGVVRVYAI